ncbi:MAG: cell division protein SepF [Firmicutes bacterium]|nr:cell division protein SepF [Bacillota bacterium]
MGFLNKFISKGVTVEKKQKPIQKKEPEFEPFILDMPSPPPPMVEAIPTPEQPPQSNFLFSGTLEGQTLGTRNVLVVTPHTNAEVTQIVQNLQRGEACVVNLEHIDEADARRRLDFLSGVICAIGGTIKGIDEKKFILTPQGLGVRGQVY